MFESAVARSAVRWFVWVLVGAVLLSACGGAPAAPASQPPTAASASGSSTTSAPAPTAAEPTIAAPTAAATAPTAAAPAGQLNRDPKTLVIANTESPDNADPAQTLNAANSLLQRGMYEGLLTLKGSSLSEVEPVLAESFTTSDDKSTWTFKIRKGRSEERRVGNEA